MSRSMDVFTPRLNMRMWNREFTPTENDSDSRCEEESVGTGNKLRNAVHKKKKTDGRDSIKFLNEVDNDDVMFLKEVIVSRSVGKCDNHKRVPLIDLCTPQKHHIFESSLGHNLEDSEQNPADNYVSSPILGYRENLMDTHDEIPGSQDSKNQAVSKDSNHSKDSGSERLTTNIQDQEEEDEFYDVEQSLISENGRQAENSSAYFELSATADDFQGSCTIQDYEEAIPENNFNPALFDSMISDY